MLQECIIKWMSKYLLARPNYYMKKFSSAQYTLKNPAKAKIIKKAVRQGMKQYAETFKRLANT